MNFIFNLINLDAVEMTKGKNIMETPVLYWHELEGNTKIKLKKNLFYFFFQFSKNWVGRVGKTKKTQKTLAKVLLGTQVF